MPCRHQHDYDSPSAGVFLSARVLGVILPAVVAPEQEPVAEPPLVHAPLSVGRPRTICGVAVAHGAAEEDVLPEHPGTTRRRTRPRRNVKGGERCAMERVVDLVNLDA